MIAITGLILYWPTFILAGAVIANKFFAVFTAGADSQASPTVVLVKAQGFDIFKEDYDSKEFRV